MQNKARAKRSGDVVSLDVFATLCQLCDLFGFFFGLEQIKNGTFLFDRTVPKMQKGLKRKARSLRGLETESPTLIFVGMPRGGEGQNMGLP